MGQSRTIIENLVADLKTFIGDSTVIYEHYRELPDDLEPRQDIPRARIALYEADETDVTKIGAEKPADSRQNYGMDVSVLRAYRGENAKHSELAALDLRDKIIDWIKQLDAYDITSGGLHSFGYESATGFTRRKRYITKTLNLSGFRDLNAQQDI